MPHSRDLLMNYNYSYNLIQVDKSIMIMHCLINLFSIDNS